jgi:hypothetical protein
VIVEYQEPAMMQIMIHGKSRLASSKRNIAFPIVIYLQLIWRPSTRSFPKDSFPNLTAIHEFSKFQRKPLTLAALVVSKDKEAKYISRQGWKKR